MNELLRNYDSIEFSVNVNKIHSVKMNKIHSENMNKIHGENYNEY